MSAIIVRSVLVAGLATICSASAFARTAEAPATEVRYGDLDLATDAGVATLHKRVAGAARRVCATGEALRLDKARQASDCRAKAMAGAVPRIETAVAAARAGQDYAANAVMVSSEGR